MGVSKNRGTPKWMVKIMENPLKKLDDLGGNNHNFRENTHILCIATPKKYCWWTKSCTTKDDDCPIIYKVFTIPGGCLGFLPSTVAQRFSGLQQKCFPTASPGQARGKPQGGATEFPAEAKLGGTSGGDRRETLWWFIQTTGEFNKCIGFFLGRGQGSSYFSAYPSTNFDGWNFCWPSLAMTTGLQLLRLMWKARISTWRSPL